MNSSLLLKSYKSKCFLNHQVKNLYRIKKKKETPRKHKNSVKNKFVCFLLAKKNSLFFLYVKFTK